MFFTYIDQVLTPGVDLNLTISKTAIGLTVLVMPRINGLNDPAQNRLIPLIITASPQELDANFFPTITAPVQKTSGMLINIDAYERQQAEAEKSSRAAKDLKEKEAKEAKEKREKYDAAIKKAEELEQAGKSEEAIVQLGQARLYATEKAAKTVDDKIAAIKATLGQGSLFDTTAAETKPVVVEPQIPQQVAQPMQIQEIAQVQQHVAQQVQIQPQPAVPVQQQPMPQSSAMQPNLGFGIFATQQQAPQPQQPATQMATIPAYSTADNTEVEWKNDYEDIIDFPQEMRPPVFIPRVQAPSVITI